MEPGSLPSLRALAQVVSVNRCVIALFILEPLRDLPAGPQTVARFVGLSLYRCDLRRSVLETLRDCSVLSLNRAGFCWACPSTVELELGSLPSLRPLAQVVSVNRCDIHFHSLNHCDFSSDFCEIRRLVLQSLRSSSMYS